MMFLSESIAKLSFLFGPGYFVLNKYQNLYFDDKSKNSLIEAVDSNEPLLIVSNHMTLSDSAILHSFSMNVFGWLGTIQRNFRPIIWNIPAKENLELLRNNYESPVMRLLHRAKIRIVPIERGDQDSSTKTLNEITNLILKGNIFNIFPEAGRTRREEFSKEDITPGAAKIMNDIHKATGKFPRVLFVYARSKEQKGHSDKPACNNIGIVARDICFNELNIQGSNLRKRKILSDLIGENLEILQSIWKEQNIC